MGSRHAGLLTDPTDLRPGDHACFGFASRTEFVEAAVAVLRTGLERDERVVFATGGPFELLRDDLTELADLDRRIEDDTITVRPPPFTPARPIEVAELVATVERDVREALDAGFVGQLTVIDITEVLVDPKAARRYQEFEHLIDRKMVAGLELTMLCCFDHTVVDPEVAATISGQHPCANGELPLFRLYATDGHDAGVWGEVDASQVGPWQQALIVAFSHGAAPVAGLDYRLDCSQLQFIDHAALEAIDSVARSWEVRVSLWNAGQGLRRLYPLVTLDSVRLSL